MKLQGGAALSHRLRAMSDAPRGVSGSWSDEYVQAARPMIPVRTGATRRSVTRGQVTSRGAEIIGSFVAIIIDRGSKAHTIEASGRRLRFQDGSRTVFARKVDHPGTRAEPFAKRAAREAADRTRFADIVIGLWNRAA